MSKRSGDFVSSVPSSKMARRSSTRASAGRVRRRRFRGRRRSYGRRRSLRRIVRSVAISSAETKWVQATSTTSVGPIGAVFAVMPSSFPQGTSQNTRIGDEIYIKAIVARFVLSNVTHFSRCMIRWWLVRSREALTAPGPVPANFYNPTTTTVGQAYVDTDRFKIIARGRSVMAPQFVDQQYFVSLRCSKSMKNVKYIFETATTSQGRFGNYYFVIAADVAQQEDITATGNCRVYFKDC